TIETIDAAGVRRKQPQRLQPVLAIQSAPALAVLAGPYVYQHAVVHALSHLLRGPISHGPGKSVLDIPSDLLRWRPVVRRAEPNGILRNLCFLHLGERSDRPQAGCNRHAPLMYLQLVEPQRYLPRAVGPAGGRCDDAASHARARRNLSSVR